MSDNLAAIERLVREHQEALYRIGGVNATVHDLTELRQEWVPGSSLELKQRLAQLEQDLCNIDEYLREHMRFEEQEVLPILTKHATDIMRRGLLFEHRRIRESIADVKEKVRGVTREPIGRDEMLATEMRIRESLNRILELVREHTNIQEAIFKLAQEALEGKK